jgi:hypothetical protein
MATLSMNLVPIITQQTIRQEILELINNFLKNTCIRSRRIRLDPVHIGHDHSQIFINHMNYFIQKYTLMNI